MTDGLGRSMPDELAAQIADLSPMVIVLIGCDGTVLFANEAMRELSGFDGEPLVGIDWVDEFVVESDRARVRARLAGLQPGHERHARIRIVPTRNGERNVEWWDRVVVGEDGEVVGVLSTGRDVTNELASAREYRQMRDQLADAQALAHIGSWSLDRATGEQSWSPEMYRILGMEPTDQPTTGDAIRARAHPDDLPIIEEAGRLAWAGESIDLVYRLVIDGAVRSIRARGGPMSAVDGAESKVVGTIQDITDSKLVEDELRRTRDQLADAQELAQFGSWFRDFSTDEVTWSPTLATIFEVGPERDRSQPGWMMDQVHPDDQEAVHEAIERSRERAEPQSIDHRLLFADGRIRWVRLRIRHEFDEHGAPLRSSGTVHDITESVDTEQRLAWARDRLEEAQRLAQIGSWTLDLGTGELDWSDQIYRIFEIDPDRFGATYAAFLEVTHPGDRELIDLEYQSSVANRTEYDLVHRLLMPDGRVKHVRERGRTEYAADGTPTRSIGTVQDVSAVVEAQLEVEALNRDLEARIEQRTAELVDARDEAESANRAKDLFVASMSHEMRTPLNAVLAYAQLLELDDRLPDDLAEDVAEIRVAGQQLLALVSDVLDLAKVESGRFDLTIEELALDQVAESCVSQLSPLAEQHGVEVTCAASMAGRWVRADLVRLRQVLSNLVSNAIKYNQPDGSVHISADFDRTTDRVRISVSDTGVGVPEERISELFEPFVRLGQERGRVEGTGIGLSISNRLVESMGGRIMVESAVGVGTTFTVELDGGEAGQPPPAVQGAPASSG